MRSGKRDMLRRRPVSAGANWLAALVMPLVVFGVCLAADLNAAEGLASDAGRAALLCFLAGVLQLLVIVSVVPWWGASAPAGGTFGGLIAVSRLAAMTVSVTVLLFLLMFLQERGSFAAAMKLQTVVLGVGLLVTGIAALLRLLFRSAAAAAVLTTLFGYLLLASPFWGNVLVRSTGGSARVWAISFVVNATPLSACASAVGYDLFRGRMLYVISAVSDYRHALPAWWTYALLTAAAGIALIALATLMRRKGSSRP